MKNEKYKNKEWLFNKYINLKLSAPKIEKICGVSNGTISYWLRKFDIPGRSISEALMGRETSEETRKKISEAMTGHETSSETRKKIGDANRGDKCYNWKGGKAKYDSDHNYVRKNKPKSIICKYCKLPSNNDPKINSDGTNNKLKLELCNIYGKLNTRDINDFDYMHHDCHMKYDAENNISPHGPECWNQNFGMF